MTSKEKLMLENKLYHLIKESFYEDVDNLYFEDDVDDEDINLEDEDDDDDEDDEDSKKGGVAAKRSSVLRWLKSDQVDMAPVAYELWGLENASEDDKDSARSLFVKKVNGTDGDGNDYSFDDDEVTKLYNLKGHFISSNND